MPYDILGLERAISTPSRGVGKKTLLSLREYLLENNLTIWEGIRSFPAPSKVKKSLLSFSDLIDSFREKVDKVPLRELFIELLRKKWLHRYASLSW